jgi:hypothetical protein
MTQRGRVVPLSRDRPSARVTLVEKVWARDREGEVKGENDELDAPIPSMEVDVVAVMSTKKDKLNRDCQSTPTNHRHQQKPHLAGA